MRFGIDVYGMDEIMSPLRQQGKDMNRVELNQWAVIIEGTAKQMCVESKNSLELRAQNTMLHFFYEDMNSKECLIRAIQRHLPLMPYIVQSIFRKLLRDLNSGVPIQ